MRYAIKNDYLVSKCEKNKLCIDLKYGKNAIESDFQTP